MECRAKDWNLYDFQPGTHAFVHDGCLECKSCGRAYVIETSILKALPNKIRRKKKDLEFFLKHRSQIPDNLLHLEEAYEGQIDSEKTAQMDVFDTSNAFGERSQSRNHQLKLELILNRLKLSGKILEIGMGIGTHGRHILEKVNCGYTGVDFSENLLRGALGHAALKEKTNILQADAQNLPFDDSIYDSVFTVSTMHHLFDVKKGISEAVRVLKPGKSFLALEPNFLPLKKFLRNRSKRGERSHTNTDLSNQNLKRWSREWGIKAVEIDYFIYTPNSPYWLFPVYGILNSVLKRLPLLRKMSVMKVITIEK